MSTSDDKQQIDAIEQTVIDELRATEADGLESDSKELHRLRAVEARVREELARYGILAVDDPLKIGAGAVAMLLRHIYNNRDATYGAKDLMIEFLQNQRSALEAALCDGLEASGQSSEQARVLVDQLLRETNQTAADHAKSTTSPLPL